MLTNNAIDARVRVKVKSNVVPGGLGARVCRHVCVISSRRTVRASHDLTYHRKLVINVSSNAGITTTLGLTGRLNGNGAIIAMLPSATRQCLSAPLFYH